MPEKLRSSVHICSDLCVVRCLRSAGVKYRPARLCHFSTLCLLTPRPKIDRKEYIHWGNPLEGPRKSIWARPARSAPPLSNASFRVAAARRRHRSPQPPLAPALTTHTRRYTTPCPPQHDTTARAAAAYTAASTRSGRPAGVAVARLPSRPRTSSTHTCEAASRNASRSPTAAAPVPASADMPPPPPPRSAPGQPASISHRNLPGAAGLVQRAAAPSTFVMTQLSPPATSSPDPSVTAAAAADAAEPEQLSAACSAAAFAANEAASPGSFTPAVSTARQSAGRRCRPRQHTEQPSGSVQLTSQESRAEQPTASCQLTSVGSKSPAAAHHTHPPGPLPRRPAAAALPVSWSLANSRCSSPSPAASQSSTARSPATRRQPTQPASNQKPARRRCASQGGGQRSESRAQSDSTRLLRGERAGQREHLQQGAK